MPMYQIGWFSTGRDEAARELLQVVWQAIQDGELKARISFVFSNREPGENEESDRFFSLVRSYQLPLICLSSRKFKQKGGPNRRLDYDREVMAKLENFHFDLGVLAGYMLIVGEEMCRRYKLINLHPSAPGGPTGTWQEVIWQLIEEKASRSGVMMHLVTPELDKGPPVTYCTFTIRGGAFDHHWRELEGQILERVKAEQGEQNALFKLIRREGLKREFPLIRATLKVLSSGRVKIKEGRALDAAGRPIPGYDLTFEIEKLIRQKG